MWSKIKSGLAWAGGILLAGLGVVAGLFFLKQKRDQEAALLESAEKAQAALDDKMNAELEAADVKADAKIEKVEAEHAQQLAEIKAEAEKKADAFSSDLAALASALDDKSTDA